MSWKPWLLSLILFFGLIPAAFAVEPYFAFEPSGATTPIPKSFQAWHMQFENNKDYGESWFFLAHTDKGGMLFAMVSITNLGLRTFDGTVDVQFYPFPFTDKPLTYHSEHKRDEVSANTTMMDATVGKARAWGSGSSYHFSLDAEEMQIKLDVEGTLPSYMFGNGAVKFFGDKSAEWTIGMNVPKGRSSGSLTMDGKTHSLSGNAYSDHGWSTIKLPDIIQKWYTLRVFDKKYGFILHNPILTKKFGGKDIPFGILGVDNQIVAASKEFTMTPTASRKQKDGGYQTPTAFDINFQADGYTVTGTLKEVKFIAAVDVLGQVSWPVRMVIKAFYSNPFMYRYLAKYELDITNKEGVKEHIVGAAVVETNFF